MSIEEFFGSMENLRTKSFEKKDCQGILRKFMYVGKGEKICLCSKTVQAKYQSHGKLDFPCEVVPMVDMKGDPILSKNGDTLYMIQEPRYSSWDELEF